MRAHERGDQRPTRQSESLLTRCHLAFPRSSVRPAISIFRVSRSRGTGNGDALAPPHLEDKGQFGGSSSNVERTSSQKLALT